MVIAQGPERPTASSQYAPGQVLVKWKNGVLSAPQYTLASGRQVQMIRPVDPLGVTFLRVPPGTEAETVQELQRDPRGVYADLNYRVRAQEVPNDPYWPQQWALVKIGAPAAWDIAHSSSDMVVALLDTGVYLGHPDLQTSLWTNVGEIPDNGIDDDHNGKADDVHGWHFFHQWNGSVQEPYENRVIDDDNGHGTHVAGIVGAETNNGIGIASVSRGARVMIVKVLDEKGDGWYSDVAAGVVYAVDNGAKIINLSLGGEEPSQVLQDAINYAYRKGALLVAAAGNDDRAVYYPAASENVVAVVATDANDQRMSFSNHGPEVDIAAPGENIISTWPFLDLYYYKRGTSMAAPHVSGAAALLWTWRPDYNNVQLEQRLEATAEDVNSASYPGWDAYIGRGRLNMARALSGLPQGPTATATARFTPTPTVTRTATPTAVPSHSATPQSTPTATPTSTTFIYQVYWPIFFHFQRVF